MCSKKLYPAILSLPLAALVVCSVARAQAGNRDQSAPAYSSAPGAVNPDSIDDATLKHTAKAYIRVRQIVEKANQDLQSTSDNAQQEQIAKQAELGKIAAVKAEGLQPQQYNQIIQLARADKAFEQKFLSYVEEVKKSSS